MVSFMHQTHYARGNSPNWALDMRHVGHHNWSQSCDDYKKPCRCRKSNPKLPLPAACSLVRLIAQLSQPKASICTSAQSIVMACLQSCVRFPHSWFSCFFFYFSVLLPIFQTDGRVYCFSCLVYVLLCYVYLLYYVCNAVFFFLL